MVFRGSVTIRFKHQKGETLTVEWLLGPVWVPQKTAGVTSVSWQQEAEATVGKGSPQLDSKQLHKHWPDLQMSTSAASSTMVMLEFVISNISLDLFCVVSTTQPGLGGVLVGGIFSWHTLGNLIPSKYWLNATAYLSMVADTDGKLVSWIAIKSTPEKLIVFSIHCLDYLEYPHISDL